MKTFRVFGLAIICFALAGCSANSGGPLNVIGDGRLTGIPGRIVDALVSPLKDFTVEDAKATLKEIDRRVALPADSFERLDEAAAAQKRKCPLSILQVAEFYDSVSQSFLGSSSSGERKGLVYLFTFYGDHAGLQQKAKDLVIGAGAECAKIVPAGRFSPAGMALGG